MERRFLSAKSIGKLGVPIELVRQCAIEDKGESVGMIFDAHTPCYHQINPPGVVQRMTHGAKGIVTGGINELAFRDPAFQQRVEERTAICGKCPHATIVAGAFQKCELCGCATWFKIRNPDEQCPIGKW